MALLHTVRLNGIKWRRRCPEKRYAINACDSSPFYTRYIIAPPVNIGGAIAYSSNEHNCATGTVSGM